VIVKRLSSIENLGSMDILCSDKTGTLTEGKVSLYKTLDYEGKESKNTFRLAYINAHFELGFNNPIDDAIRNFGQVSMDGIKKVDELPYDFNRKCLSILISDGNKLEAITKGAFEQIVNKCSEVQDAEGKILPMEDVKESLMNLYRQNSQDGYRVLGIASRSFKNEVEKLTKADESELVFQGMLLFLDPPKKDAYSTIMQLRNLGIKLKIITGDNPLVAEHISRQIGFDSPHILSGSQIRQMGSDALVLQAAQTDIFAAVEPNQKESILIALKKSGHVVGFIGDGINDAPALHTADVGISVSGAVDVAKEAADIVLLGNDLQVLINGVREGRKTFANTLKYIFMATSANFGNMFSMAGSSLFLKFLPLLPKQVLLT
ncbi:MAG TPA: HAD-IC family P-type ATPase, partial [Puia sp.]|nr:HAD-IC family P-type ATPase [Puia sp.]